MAGENRVTHDSESFNAFLLGNELGVSEEVKKTDLPAGDPPTDEGKEQEGQENPIEKRIKGLVGKLKSKDEAIAEKEVEIAELKAKLITKQPQEEIKQEGKPQAKDFKDIESYTDALTDWKIDQFQKQQTAKQQQAEAKAAQKSVADSFQSRQIEFQVATPDYEDVIEAIETPIKHQEVGVAILESELGPQLLYHIAKNPELIDELNKLSPTAALRKLGKLEVTLEAPKNQEKPAPKPSSAPAPITPVKGGTATGELPLDKMVVGQNCTLAEYRARKQTGK